MKLENLLDHCVVVFKGVGLCEERGTVKVVESFDSSVVQCSHLIFPARRMHIPLHRRNLFICCTDDWELVMVVVKDDCFVWSVDVIALRPESKKRGV